jgi:hypothetical protein
MMSAGRLIIRPRTSAANLHQADMDGSDALAPCARARTLEDPTDPWILKAARAAPPPGAYKLRHYTTCGSGTAADGIYVYMLLAAQSS